MSSDPVDPSAARKARRDEFAGLSDAELNEAPDFPRGDVVHDSVIGRREESTERPSLAGDSCFAPDDERRFVIVVDIAGRVSKESHGNPRVTAAALAIPLPRVATLRDHVGRLPKWKACSPAQAKSAVDLILREASAISIFSVDKGTDRWRAAVADGELLHSEISTQSGPGAGWAKPSVLLAIVLLARTCFGAEALTLGRWRDSDPQPENLKAFEFSVVSDTELAGDETIALFKSFWHRERVPFEKLAVLGCTVDHRSVEFMNEQTEPLLLLADYAAGIAHSAHLPHPGRLSLPIDHASAGAMLGELHGAGKLLVEAGGFNISYDRIFGPAMDEARARRAARRKP